MIPPASGVNKESRSGRVVYIMPTGNLGQLRIEPYTEKMVRVRWSPLAAESSDILESGRLTQLGSFWPVESEVETTPECYIVRTPAIEIRISRIDRLRLEFYDAVTGRLLCRDESNEYDGWYRPEDDPTYARSRSGDMPPPVGFRVKSTKEAPLGECYLGLGDWGGPLNRRTALLQFWNEDAWGWEELRNPKYTAMPIYHTLSPSIGHLYSIFVNNSSRTMFDMCRTSPKKLSFQVSDGALDYFFIGMGGKTMERAMYEFCTLTGRPALLPKWGYGYHMSKFTYTQSEMEEVLEKHRLSSVPLSAIFVDLDYMDQLPSTMDDEWLLVQFKWGPAYPSPRPLIKSMWDQGIATVVIVEPFVTDEDPKFDQAMKKRFFVEDSRGKPLYTDLWCAERAGWIDYTKPLAAQWWGSELSAFLREYGISGVWNDLNETADKGKIPLDAVYGMGRDLGKNSPSRSRVEYRENLHASVKNIYSIYNTKTSYQASVAAFPGRRPFVLSRGAFPGIQKWAAGWSGDNLSTEDHLRCNIRVGTSMGISGLSNFGHDIGGFSGVPSPEVMERWQEWAVYTPLMRNHYSKQSKPREFYRFSTESSSRLVGTILQRYYLLPTVYSLAKQAHLTGWPIAAPVPAVFPSDPKTYSSNENDIMLGSSMLAAPVVKVGESSRRVYLPEVPGGWFSFWEERAWQSGDNIVDAPLGRSPVFVRAGAILPVASEMLGPSRPQGRKSTDWHEQLEIHVWPSAPGRFVVYDDDGITPLGNNDHRRISVKVTTQSAGGRWLVTLSSDKPLEKRKWKVVLRGLASPPGEVRLNGSQVEIDDRLPVKIAIPPSRFPLSALLEVDNYKTLASD